MNNKDIRLKDIISLLGGRTKVNIYESKVDTETGRRIDYMKPFFDGCIDEDFNCPTRPTWTSGSKKIKEIRDKYSDYYVLDMNVYDDLQDQTLNIWVSGNQEI